LRLKNHAHAASAELPQNFIMRNCFADHVRTICEDKSRSWHRKKPSSYFL
jgi:hypothetical protein